MSQNGNQNKTEQNSNYNILHGNQFLFITNDEDFEDQSIDTVCFCQNCKRHEYETNSIYKITLESCEKKDNIKRRKFYLIEKDFTFYKVNANQDEYLLFNQCKSYLTNQNNKVS